ncbi:MAG: hypothetical protein LBG60_04575, partial [Bifidobacteriaceae bacterium]|nr:hypothetical protein [Bifidobacteriaceae bacterium]
MKVLFEACSRLIFGFGDRSDPNPAREWRVGHKRSVLEGSEVFKRLANWPVLAFLLWAAFDRGIDIQERHERVTKPMTPDEWLRRWLERIGQLEADVLDIADGLLQLTENVVLHAGSEGRPGRGVLALRVHDRGLSWTNSLLRKAYPQYFRGRDNRRLINIAREPDLDRDPLSDCSSDDLLERQDKHLGGQPIDPPLIESEPARWVRNLEDVMSRQQRREAVQQYLEVKLADCGAKGIPGTFQDGRAEGKFLSLTELRGFCDPTKDQRKDWRESSKNSINVVNHYGLALFDSLLAGMDGAMGVTTNRIGGGRETYCSSGDDVDQLGLTDAAEIGATPGTRYSLLIPMSLRDSPERPLAHADVDLHLEPDHDITAVEVSDSNESGWREFRRELGKTPPTTGQQKIAWVSALAARARDASEWWAGTHIAVFDASGLDAARVEALCKAVLLWLSERENTHVAIRVRDEYQFRSLVRVLVMFFDRDGINNALNESQVYLVGNGPGDEWWLPDAGLGAAISAQLKLMSARSVGGGISSPLTNELTRVLARRPTAGPDADQPKPVTMVPFDLKVLATPGSSRTLFDRAAKHVLKADIQDPEGPGCRLGHAHARIGSKVHLDAFYEAELLFANQYYVDRYAWCVRQIMREEEIDRDDRCLIIGYETYSEMLVQRVIGAEEMGTCQWIPGILDKDAPGIRMSLPNGWSADDVWADDTRHVYLVPITATMTTFRKMGNKVVKQANARPGNRAKWRPPSPPVLVTAIHVRAKRGDGRILEQSFFEDCEAVAKAVKLRFDVAGERDRLAHYVHRVHATWMDPLTCPKCFPLGGGEGEMPLAEPSRSPVVLSDRK